MGGFQKSCPPIIEILKFSWGVVWGGFPPHYGGWSNPSWGGNSDLLPPHAWGGRNFDRKSAFPPMILVMTPPHSGGETGFPPMMGGKACPPIRADFSNHGGETFLTWVFVGGK